MKDGTQARREELREKRSQQIRWSTIVQSVERKYGSTDLRDDQLFVLVFEALKESGFELHESDVQRYNHVKSKVGAN
jgi:hypothetical protein